MATIGSLDVAVRARIGSFLKGIAKARKSLARFSRAIPMANANIGKLGVGLAAVATGGLALYTREAFKAIDASAKMSDVLGMSNKFYESLKYSAELGGVAVEQVGTAMRRFQKSVGDANVGSATAVRAFRTLGLESQKLSQMTPQDALLEVFDALNKLPNQFDRARVAQDVFGRTGLQMLKVAEGGSEQFSRYTAQLEKFGVAIDRVDSAKVEQANDAWTTLGKIFEGVSRQIAINLAPLITEVAGSLTEAGSKGQGMGEKIKVAFNTAMDWAKVFMQGLDAVRVYFNALQTGIDFISGAIVNSISTMVKGLELAAKYSPAALFTDVDFSGMTNYLDRLADTSFAQAGTNFEELKQSLDDLMNDQSAKDLGGWISGAYAKAQEGAVKVAEATKKHLEPMKTFFTTEVDKLESFAKSLIDQTRTPMEKFEAQIAKIQEVFSAGLIDPETMRRGATAAFDVLKNALKKSEPEPMKSTFARQIDLNNISLAGPSQKRTPQKIESPQIEEGNKILNQILAQLQAGVIGGAI